jgi:hypothetical protein
MVPAGILGFMLPGETEEGFYADPPIQRSKDREANWGWHRERLSFY